MGRVSGPKKLAEFLIGDVKVQRIVQAKFSRLIVCCALRKRPGATVVMCLLSLLTTTTLPTCLSVKVQATAKMIGKHQKSKKRVRKSSIHGHIRERQKRSRSLS